MFGVRLDYNVLFACILLIVMATLWCTCRICVCTRLSAINRCAFYGVVWKRSSWSGVRWFGLKTCKRRILVGSLLVVHDIFFFLTFLYVVNKTMSRTRTSIALLWFAV